MTTNINDLIKSTVAGPGGAHILHGMFGARGPLLNQEDGGTSSVTVAPNQPVTPSSPVPTLQPPAPPAPRMFTQQEVEQARQDEKSKLYSEMSQLKEKMRLLERQQQTPEAQNAQDMQAMRETLETAQRTLGELNNQVAQLTAANAAEQSRRRAAELQLFLNQRVKAYQDAGHGLIIEMIRGSNEQEIEAAIQSSAQAYRHYFGQVAPTANVPVTVQVQPAPQIQNGFPSVPNPQAVVQNNPSNLGWFDATKQMTTEEAVRSGEWGKNRQQVMAQLQQAGGGVSGQLASTPRFTPMPGAVPQSTWQNVQQPQALPIPQVVPPHVPQGQQPQFMQMQPYQPQQPQFVQPPQFTPGFDPNDARQQAIRAAQGHLANPQTAPNNGQTSSALSRHHEYPARPNTQVSFNGTNPMHRNSDGVS